MKKIFLLLICIIPFIAKAQTDEYVKDLPEYSTVQNDTTDVMYVDDGGIDKHIEMRTLLGVINDTADAVRGELADSVTVLRGLVTGGGGAWSKTGNYVSLAATTDSVTIGGTISQDKLEVEGYIRGWGINVPLINLGDSIGLIYSSGDNLYFYDVTAGVKTLSQLSSGGIFSLTGSTYYPSLTSSFNFGGNSSTTYKVKITGSLNVTGNAYFDSPLLLSNGSTYSNSLYVSSGTNDMIYSSDDGTTFKTGGRAMSTGTANGTYVGVINYDPTDYTPSPAIEGDMWYDDSENVFKYYNGSTTVNVGTGSGGGNDTIMYSGDPETNVYASVTTWENGDSTLVTMTSSQDVAGSASIQTISAESEGVVEARMYVGATQIAVSSDYITMTDSVKLTYAQGNYEQWLGVTTTGAVFADSLDFNAGFYLTLNPNDLDAYKYKYDGKFLFEPIESYMSDLKLVDKFNELKWWYVDRRTSQLKFAWGIKKLSPMEQLNALMGGIERSLVYTLENHRKLTQLESKLEQTQYELDELKRSYAARLRILEDKILDK